MKLRPLSCNKVVQILEKIGFQKIRQKGSHLIMSHPDGRITTIPIHNNEPIGKGLLKEIIEDSKMTKDEFMKIASE